MGSRDSTNQTTTSNTDKRIAVGDGGLAVSADKSTVSVNVMDGGIVKDALNMVDHSNVINGQSFDNLLAVATDLFDKGQNLIGQTQQAVADAYSKAQTDAKSTIDNRTIIVLGVAAAGVATAFALRKR